MLRDYTLRSWLTLIAALLAVVLLSACASRTVNIRLPDGSQAEGDADAIAMIYAAQLESRRLERQAFTAQQQCDGATLSEAGEVACFHNATIQALTGGRNQQANLMDSYQRRKAQESQARWNFAGQALSTAATLGVGYFIGSAIEAGFDAAQSNNSQTEISNFVEVDDEGSVTGDFALAGEGHQAVGGSTQSIGSAQGGSALDSNDSVLQPEVNQQGGEGETAGSGGTTTINPVDAESDASLFRSEP